jgi:short-subunit dehydrogenase/fatty acid desaturase
MVAEETLAAVRKRVARRHPDEIRALHGLRPLFNAKILVLAALWLAGASASLASPWLWAPGWFLSGCGLYGLAILTHEGAHHLLARSHAWNRWLAFVCAAPVLVSASAYRINHTTHHAHNGTDLDPADLVASSKRNGIPFPRLVGLVLTLGTFLVVPSIGIDGYRKADAAGRRQILVEYALIAALALAGVLFLPGRVLLHAWLVPFLFTSLANNLRSLAEHALTDRADPLRNTRTVVTVPWVRFVLSNVNHHWEHHLFPGVPGYHLPALRRLTADERARYWPPEARTYLGWLRDEVVPALRSSLSLRGRWTLVTGASSGLGEQIARTVARDHGGNLVLVARRTDRLEALARELRDTCAVQVACVTADLAEPADVRRCYEEATRGRVLHAAVLNAGVAWLGRAMDQPFDDVEAMLSTNVRSTVWLSQKILADMVARGTPGALMFVSSLAGVTPTPWLAAYSGTKAFLAHYGLALGEECTSHGVSVTVFAPGGIRTEMGEKTGTARKFGRRGWRSDLVMMEADACAQDAVRALVRRSRFAVPGRLNRLTVLSLRFTPRTWATAISARVYRDLESGRTRSTTS